MAREFWGGHPLEFQDRVLRGVELYQHIWEEQGLSPLEYQLRVLDSVEAFCVHHEIDFPKFLEKGVFGCQSGVFLSAKGALSMVGKFLIQLTHSRDVRKTVLELLEPSARLISPKTVTRLVRVDEAEGIKTALVLQILDTSFQNRFPGYDAESWLGFLIRNAPNRLAVASFDEVECLCQVRDAREILEAVPRGIHPVKNPSGWSLHGEQLTRSTSFLDWLTSQGVRRQDLSDVPDHPVEVALVDVFCPVRKRIVIHAGSLTGAKCYLMRVQWSEGSSVPVETGVAHLIREVMGENGPSEMDRASELHEHLLAQYRQRLQFVYHRQDETISCNGEHLLRGVPAKILHKVLMSHTVTGRTNFEHREFRRDPDLHLDPVNPNLESRIRILSDRLEERLQGIRIAKSGRGRFELESKLMIEFSEE